jgi:HMG (high mobility group) box
MAENYAAAVRVSGLGPNMVMPATFGTMPQVTPAGKRKAQALEEGQSEGKKKRKARAPKDPNAPKRPASSYLMFQNDIRAELKKKHPEISNADLLGMISKQWQGMTDEQKSVSVCRVCHIVLN